MILIFRSLLLSMALLVSGQVLADDTVPLNATLVVEETSVQPGRPFWVAVRLEMEDQWHAYWKNPGGAGFPTQISWHLPAGYTVGDVQWPFPERFVQPVGVHYGYTKEVWLLAQITPPKDLAVSEQVPIQADVNWLVCSDSSCLPGDTKLQAHLPVSTALPTKDSQWINGFTQSKAKLPKTQSAMKAEFSEEGIKLSLQIEGDVRKAYFCPEPPHIIDEESEIVLEKQEDPGQYHATIKVAPKKDEALPSYLKGTLVVHKGNTLVEAWDVQVPVQGTLPDDIAMADDEPALIEDSSAPIAALQPDMLEGGFGTAMVFAFIGGLLLNLMPCVLPVISLKIFSFVKIAGKSRRLIFRHGLLFSLGVLLSFWFLAGVLLILQSYGRSVGWGFQLQDPLFVAVLAAVVLLVSLSMFGIFEMGTTISSWAGQTQHDSSKTMNAYLGSFFSGILATAVATPCTGPFLGSAVGFASTLSPPLSMLIFTSLGLGMASPYLLFSAFPDLLRLLPKPGSWMITFKELMGFFMLATALWLVWVFSAQTSQLGVFILLAGLLSLAFGCWIYGKWGAPHRRHHIRWLGAVVALIFLAVGGYAIVESATFQSTDSPDPRAEEVAVGAEIAKVKYSSRGWEVFSAKRVAELQKQNIPVLIDFTAKWCLICQTNHIVLSLKEVNDRMQELGVVKMEADWTKNDPAITAELRKFGRNGVPLYLLYGRDPTKQPYILPQILTPDKVMEYLNMIGDPEKSAKG